MYFEVSFTLAIAVTCDDKFPFFFSWFELVLYYIEPKES